MKRKHFGTDGIRGRVGEHPITPDFVIKLGWAIGHYFAEQFPGESNTIMIGKDTRISGYMFESALQAGLVASGVNVQLIGPMPTPAIAYLTRTFNAKAGIVISASHNAYHDNGIKLFSGEGAKFNDAAEQAIEAYIDMPLQTVSSDKLGKVTRINDAAGRYIEYCKGTVPQQVNLKGLRIVIDCANGATYHVAPSVFSELGADVVTMGVEPDGYNINADVGSTSPEALCAKVKEMRADLGIAFDGDGDRVLFVRKTGGLIDGDELLYLLAAGQQSSQAGYAGVVGTVMTNLGIEKAIRELGMDFVRANVGDRYVKAQMHANQWLLGGESSGHLICGNITTTGDGIIAALQVLKAIKQSVEVLNERLARIKKFPQKMINVSVSDKGIIEHPLVTQAIHMAEETLGDRGRILLRPSGTEPVIRVMVEGEQHAEVDALAKIIADTVIEAGQLMNSA